MEKRIRILMLVLCMFLLPLRVSALEEIVMETGNNNETVVIEENQNSEINDQLDLENLEKIENPEEILQEEITPVVEETTEPTRKVATSVENATEPVVGVSNENETPAVIEPVIINSITLEGVKQEFVEGDSFTFAGTSGNPEQYTLDREDWIYYDEVDKIATSDATYQQELENTGTYLEVAEKDVNYFYSFVVTVKDGYVLAESFDISINGKTYAGFMEEELGNNQYYVWTTLACTPYAKDATYVEKLDIENVVTDAYVGKTPYYGASTPTEHFTVLGESWEYLNEVEREDGSISYRVYINASNDMLTFENPTFTTFESGKEYYYRIVVLIDDGYRLNYEGSVYDNSYNVTINGEKTTAGVFEYDDEELGGHVYEIFFDGITPTEAETIEIVENNNPVMEAAQDVSVGIDGTFDNLENAYLDGTLIAKENYTVKDSTITLLEDFIKTLAQGAYELAMRFKDGKMSFTTITIQGEEQQTTQATTTSYQTTSSEPVVQEVITKEEKTQDGTLEVQKDKQDKKEEKNNTNVGLIIFLGILIIIAIAIPITTYKKEQ